MSAPKLIPKSTPESAWSQVPAERDIAIRANKNENVNLRFGAGQGVYLSIAPAPSGRHVFGIDYETGDQTLLAKMPEGQPIVVGRISECLIKIMHAIVSRKHVELRLEKNVVIVRDLGSTNGTFIAADAPHFDIGDYIRRNPLEGAEERTLDSVHEQFGPTLDDFLRSYSENRKED